MSRRQINPGVTALEPSEAQIQRAIVDLLNYLGFLVIETSQVSAVARGLIGTPDVLAFKKIDEHTTVLLLCEVKSRTGKLRPSQQLFADRAKEHLSDTMIYCVARSTDDVLEAIKKLI